VELLKKFHLEATGCHHMESHGVTSARHKWTPHLNPSQRLVLNLPTLEGWKAELT